MTLPSAELHYTQTRQLWGDGGFSIVNTLRFPAEGLTFAEIDQRERAVKLSEIACLRSVKALARGVASQSIVVFSRLEHDRAVSQAFPDVDPYTETGERLYSANSLLAYTLKTLLSRSWLCYDGREWRSSVPETQQLWRNRAHAALRVLTSDDRLFVGGVLGRRTSAATSFESFDVRRDLTPVDRLGFPREFVWREHPRIVFNAAFFLLEHDDFFSHHSALGEAYNLYVRDGAILRPPLFRRAAFYQTADGHWQAGYFAVADLTVTLPDNTILVPNGSRLAGIPFAPNPTGSADVAIYTRAFGLESHGQPLRCTPVEPGRIEFTVIDTRIVGRKSGGGVDLPQNGLVLSFAPGSIPGDAIPDGAFSRVRYGFVRETHSGILQAIQAGPMLLKGGQCVVSAGSLVGEEFWPTPLGCTDLADVGVVPTDYPDDVNQTRAGRTGLGVDGEGGLIAVAVSGTERGSHRPDADSAGATLLELAGLLAQAGAVDGINLDGGGSTQVFYLGGLTTPPGNRYGMPGAQFERMVPSVGVLF